MDFLSQLSNITAQLPRGFEIIILLVIVAILLLIGPKKLPELARGIGKALGEFRRGRMEIEKEIKRELAQTPPVPEAQKVVEISPRILDAAKQLGIDVLGRKERDLKVAIIKSLDTIAEEKLESLGKALGLKTEGLDTEELKDSINEALGI
ncbi:MAG: twin-arginine translocase TatA/TatE family subunit [Thermoplasmata archaeon]